MASWMPKTMDSNLKQNWVWSIKCFLVLAFYCGSYDHTLYGVFTPIQPLHRSSETMSCLKWVVFSSRLTKRGRLSDISVSCLEPCKTWDQKVRSWTGVVVYTFNQGTPEAEAGSPRLVGGQPGLYNGFQDSGQPELLHRKTQSERVEGGVKSLQVNAQEQKTKQNKKIQNKQTKTEKVLQFTVFDDAPNRDRSARQTRSTQQWYAQELFNCISITSPVLYNSNTCLGHVGRFGASTLHLHHCIYTTASTPLGYAVQKKESPWETKSCETSCLNRGYLSCLGRWPGLG